MKRARPSGVAALYLRNERFILGAGMILFLLLVWQGLGAGWWADLLSPVVGPAAEKLRVRPIFISSPSAVAAKAWEMYFVTGEIWKHIGLSALEIAVGLGLAIVTGIPLGLWGGRSRYGSYALEPFMAALNATPQVAFLPLIVLWVGAGFWCRVVVIYLLTLVPILMNAHAAVKTIDPRLEKVAKSFSASEWRFFLSIVLPASVPFLLAGLRLGIGRAMIGVVVGELYGASIGVGILINRAGSLFRTDIVFVGVFTIVAAGLLLTELLRQIERRVEIWRPGNQEQPT